MGWLADVPEAPGGNDTERDHSFNNESEADAGDDMPEIRNSLGGPFCLRCVRGTKPGG